jgi:hypothetical protein
MAPMAKVVATDEPETAAKIMQVSTQVMGRPPCTPPTRLLANSTRRREMPPASIRLPARMKKGMAASGNLLMAPNISLTEMSMCAFEAWIPRMDARPIDTATEMVSAKHSTMVEIITMLIAPSPVPCGVGRSGCPRCRAR